MRTIEDVMTEVPVMAQATDLIGEVRDTLLESGMHCLPVVNDKGRLVGIVTSWDLVEEYAAQESVSNAMTSRVMTVGAHQSIGEAASMMQANFIHHLVVVDETDKVVGILSSLDLLDELTESLEGYG